MKTSLAGIALIKAHEGLRLTAYRDPVGVWTIGYGHTTKAGPPVVKAGMTITKAEAETILRRDLAKYERWVDQLVTTDINQNQFDALVSFCYNVGPDIDSDLIPEGLGDSTLLKKVNARDFAGAAREFHNWTKGTINGKKTSLPGLVRRRREEAALFMRPATMPQPDDPGPDPVPQPKPAPKSWWQRLLIFFGLGGTAGTGAAYEYGVGLDLLIGLGVLALVTGVVAYIVWRNK